MAFSARLHGHGVLGILHGIGNSLLTNINKRIDKERFDSVLTSIEPAFLRTRSARDGWPVAVVAGGAGHCGQVPPLRLGI